ncbi:hypothetical protein HDV00_006055 [Rhizophlyctis rosea]|nr:hypothetical protein HDV00_006055 [Rhizophlyctis rosea]
MSTPDDEALKASFRDVLSQISAPGAFATGDGPSDTLSPLLHLTIDGVGRVAFPLCREQAASIKAVCEVAPFGKGSDTIVDVNVRKAWQVGPEKVRLTSDWDRAIRKLVRKEVAPKLGLCDDTRKLKVTLGANLYKVVYYEEGGFFVTHRDSEKEPGMFATLVVQLPSKHEGGGLHIRHKGETEVFKFDEESEDGIFYAAFFCDLEHELKPLTSGHRLCLIYNLIQTCAAARPTPVESVDPTIIASITQQWEKGLGTGSTTLRKLAFKLDHRYTPTKLSFGNLKGRDAGIAHAFAHPHGGSQPLSACLVLLEKVEIGSASGGYRHSYKRRRMDEVEESTTETRDCVLYGGDDTAAFVKRVGVDPKREIVWEDEEGGDLFAQARPDDRELEDYMGNEGGTLTYRMLIHLNSRLHGVTGPPLKV